MIGKKRAIPGDFSTRDSRGLPETVGQLCDISPRDGGALVLGGGLLGKFGRGLDGTRQCLPSFSC